MHFEEQVGRLQQLISCRRRSAAPSGFHQGQRNLPPRIARVALLDHEPRHSQTHAGAVALGSGERAFEAFHGGILIP